MHGLQMRSATRAVRNDFFSRWRQRQHIGGFEGYKASSNKQNDKQIKSKRPLEAAAQPNHIALFLDRKANLCKVAEEEGR
jgi:hypothetical protein